MSDTNLTVSKAPIKLLLVDDNVIIRTLLRLIFANGNYEVNEAENGEEAIAKIAENKPDIVLLDVMMPGEMNGLAVCEYIRSSSLKYCWIILLSAKSQKDDFEQGMNAGADFYITKPFSPRELMNLVEKIEAQL